MAPRPTKTSGSNHSSLIRLLAAIVLLSVLLLLCSNLVVLHHQYDQSISLLQPVAAPAANTTIAPMVDPCQREYDRITNNTFRTPGLLPADFQRSRAYPGNRFRIQQFTETLTERRRPVQVVVCGGSISLGHGVTPVSMRYSNQLDVWLNAMYPLSQQKQHVVHNKGSHGADMCAMAKRINSIGLWDIQPDLIVLEFGVNDYQGQDHRVHIDHKTDVFFDGFERLALCAETVVFKLLHDYPNAAIVFLEFQTAILNRKTAQLLHMGVAQHYQIPVISYADTMFPPFLQLARRLEQFNYSLPPKVHVPETAIDQSAILPYPHGCTACQAQHIIPQFRDKGCKSLCIFLQRAGLTPVKRCDATTEPCYTSFLAHDAVHPSAVGHGIAKDVLVEWIATTARDACRGDDNDGRAAWPFVGWMVAGQDYQHQLRALSEFEVVYDTMRVFASQDPLESSNHSAGFALEADIMGRKGWISTNPTGGEHIVFDVVLAPAKCYAIVLSALHSYETVGAFSVSVRNVQRKTQTAPMVHDCVWKPKISIPADVVVAKDGTSDCTGRCQVIVTTLPAKDGRKGNTIKITSLAVRKCMEDQA